MKELIGIKVTDVNGINHFVYATSVAEMKRKIEHVKTMLADSWAVIDATNRDGSVKFTETDEKAIDKWR